MNSTKQQEFCHNCRKYFSEYSEVTGIHGIRYIAEKRTRLEKVLWIIIMILSVVGCIYMICEIWSKYQNSPFVVSFESRDTKIYEIPFPAVTICPQSNFLQSECNYTNINFKIKRNEILTEEELHHYYYLKTICSYGNLENRGPETLDAEDFYEFLDQVKPQIWLDYTNCYWMNNEYPCEELFIPIITDVGICYSFNILKKSEFFRNHVVQPEQFHNVVNDSNNFNFDTGYSENAGVQTYPRRALMSGSDNSLQIFLRQDNNEIDYLCNLMQGFQVAIHSPIDLPAAAKDFFPVPLNKAVSATISPSLVITSAEVIKFSPGERECYLGTERSLKHFNFYTQRNCMLECLTNFTLNKCGCVEHYMPRDYETAICGTARQSCLEEASHQMQVEELQNKISRKLKKGDTSCDCKPLCTELSYNVESSQNRFHWKPFFLVHSNDEYMLSEEETSISYVNIYFKTEQFLALEKNELYGISDLISNFGGILGLFTGFSLLSVVEIVYFLSLRPFCNVQLFGLWSGPKFNNAIQASHDYPM